MILIEELNVKLFIFILDELIREGTIDEIKEISKKKCEFMFNNFGKMIKENDEYQYVEKNSKSNEGDFDEDNI